MSLTELSKEEIKFAPTNFIGTHIPKTWAYKPCYNYDGKSGIIQGY